MGESVAVYNPLRLVPKQDTHHVKFLLLNKQGRVKHQNKYQYYDTNTSLAEMEAMRHRHDVRQRLHVSDLVLD